MTTPDFFLFVSHVSNDQSAAMDIVGELERRGVPCWIAPRNIRPGKPFDDEIAEAIDGSRAMLLIFSEQCNESEYIRREVTVAGEAGKVIIPFRIDNAHPRKGLRVRLTDLHWIDGFVSRERAIDELVSTFHLPKDKTALTTATDRASRGDTPPVFEQSAGDGRRGGERAVPHAAWLPWRAFLAGGALAAVLAGGVFVWVKVESPTQTPQPASAPAVQPTPAPAQPLPKPTPGPTAATTPAPTAAPTLGPTPGPSPAPSISTPIAFTPLSPERERALKPKDMFKECDKCPEMLVVPAGSFTMGSPESERVPIVAAWQSYGITPGTLTTGVALSSEGPQHKVVIAQPIAVGRFAVTFEEWDACVDDRGCNGYRPADQDWGRGSRPVINVNWNDAKAYVAWLSQKTGKKYRLLSEAEWEYIARAGTTTSFWWGSSFSTSQANYNGTHTYGGEPTGEDRQKTLPVESFSPNPWGFYQVAGNSYDWIEDCFHDDYYGAPVDGSAWLTENCKGHVVRGGSWTSAPWNIRSAFRGWFPTNFRSSNHGFRLARTLMP